MPVRTIRQHADVRPLEVTEVAKQQMTVDAVTLRLTQRHEVRRLKLEIRSEVERHDVVCDEP